MASDERAENRKKVLIAVLMMLGGLDEEQVAAFKDLKDAPKAEVDKASVNVKKLGLDALAETDEELTQPRVQQAVLEAVKERSSKKGEALYFEVLNPGDEKTCVRCAKWIGAVLSDEDGRFKSTTDWFAAGACHVGCRCSLHKIEDLKEIDRLAAEYESEKAYNQRPCRGLVFNSGAAEGLVFFNAR